MEMNMHVPQSLQAWMELEYLAAVPHHFISPSSNDPIIKPSQDNLLGVFKITGDDVLLSQIEAQHLLSGTEAFNGALPEPAVKEGRYIRWSGRQIYSAILPPINLTAKAKNESIEPIVIENGIMKSGRIDKGVSGKIVKAIHSEFGSKLTERYMNDLQRIISRYLVKSGFSVGVSDLVVHPDIVKKNRATILDARDQEVELTKKIHLNILEDIAGDLSSVYDSEISMLNSALDKKLEKQVIKNLDYRDNRVAFMVASGAKGKDTNIKQMMVSLGQQTIDGGRVPINFTDRTHPAYPRYENGMESRGFISDNYREGLHPIPFYFHAMSGRVGLIDTAVKTATSGYLQRKLVKSMEDLKTYGDGTIRDSTGEIIEFLYGGDMFESSKLEIYGMDKLPLRLVTQESLYSRYLFRRDEKFSVYMSAKSISSMKKYKDNTNNKDSGDKSDSGKEGDWQKKLNHYNARVQKVVDMIHTLLVRYDGKLNRRLFFPVNIPKLIQATREIFKLDQISPTTKSDLSPLVVIDAMAALVDDECAAQGYKNKTFEMIVYSYMSPKILIRDYKFHQKALDYLLAQIRRGFEKGKMVPGEMVGPLAAQSIGEQSTQLSTSPDEEIVVYIKDGDKPYIYSGKIGTFIDDYFDNTKDDIHAIHNDGNSRNAFVSPSKEMYILTVDPKKEKTIWQKIGELSRHPANGGMVKVTTKSKRSVTTTLAHSHLKKTEDGIVSIRGDQLEVGQRIPVAFNVPMPGTSDTIDVPNLGTLKLDSDLGWFIGAYLANGGTRSYLANDGTSNEKMCVIGRGKVFEEAVKKLASILNVIATNFSNVKKQLDEDDSASLGISHCWKLHPAFCKFMTTTCGNGLDKNNINIPEFAYCSNKQFVSALLQGYFDTNGHVSADALTTDAFTNTVMAHSKCKSVLLGIGHLLSYFGIRYAFGLEKIAGISIHDVHTIKVFQKDICKFSTHIGSRIASKQQAIANVIVQISSGTKTTDEFDCIPAIGNLLYDIARPLGLPEYCEITNSFEKLHAVGRDVITKFINVFETCPNAELIDQTKIQQLKTAVASDVFWDQIETIEILEDPQTLVYDIGVPGNNTFAVGPSIMTHNTLNSVDFKEEIDIMKNNEFQIVTIGEFIDELLTKYPENIEHIKENRTEYLELPKDMDIQVPANTKDGKVGWYKMTAITRHLPVGDMIKVTTDSGRVIKATRQKSFLKYQEDTKTIEAVVGTSLKVGDLVPVCYKYPKPPNTLTEICLRQYLCPTKYLYGNDFHTCGEYYGIGQDFWKYVNKYPVGKTIPTLPYTRSECFLNVWKNKNIGNKIDFGYVYIYNDTVDGTCDRTCDDIDIDMEMCCIPDIIQLDRQFGFIVGVYISTTRDTRNTNTNLSMTLSVYGGSVLNNITTWLDKHNIKYSGNLFDSYEYFKLIINSELLATLFTKLFGDNNQLKLPSWTYNGDDSYLHGIIDGYISNTTTITDGIHITETGYLSIPSISENITISMCKILSFYNIPTKFNNGVNSNSPLYYIDIHYEYIKNILDHITYFTSPSIQLIIDNLIYQPPRDNLHTLQDLFLDPIVKIEEEPASTQYVYDLTVPGPFTFMNTSNCPQMDTFHLAGVGSASSVTQGVPRLNELLTITKDPKTPSCILYLYDKDRFDRTRATQVKNNIEQTKIRDILKGDPAFYLEPTGRSAQGALEEDKAFMKFYDIFQELDDTANKQEALKNPWLIRMEFNRKEMIERSVSMGDIQQILSLVYPDASLMYSDDNAAKLVFRVRVPFERRDNVEDDYKELHNKAEDIKDIIIKGVDNIDRVFVSPAGTEHNVVDFVVHGKTSRGHSKIGEVYESREEYRLTTQGSNLFDLLVRDDIDDTRSYCNDPNEMTMIFGIEAGKYTIEHEFYGIMDNPTNPRHISLLVNKITHNGSFMSINSHGINKEDIGPLAKCSFEETDRQLRQAAMFGDIDRLHSVSANIIMGQIPSCGTGSIKLYMDEEALEEGLEELGLMGKKQSTATETGGRSINEAEVMEQFRSEICVTDDERIRLGPVESDGLSLAYIPQVGVE